MLYLKNFVLVYDLGLCGVYISSLFLFCLVFLEKTKQSCVGKVSNVIREKSLKEKKI